MMIKKVKKLTTFKMRANKLKQDVYVLFLAYKDSRVPWYAKFFAICVVAYAFSPVDLIPDFIPILGYLDDLIIVPVGVALALKMIPKPILDEYRTKVELLRQKGKPKNWISGILIITIWVLCAVLIGLMIYKYW